jgi:lipopolysaccharide export system permease protein
MIIHRSLIQEVLRTSLVVTVIVVSIFLVLRVMGFLSQAAEGIIPVDSVLILVSLKMVAYLDVMLPLMFYIAILMVMGRWYKEHEMAILSSAGLSLLDLLKPLFFLVLIVASLVALFSFWLTPLSLAKGYQIENEYRQRNDIAGVIPGIFIESKTGNAVYFVEKYNKEVGQYENVFLYKNAFNREGVVVADRATQVLDQETGDEFLVLLDGSRYEGEPGTPEYRVIDFERYALRIETKQKPLSSLPIRARNNAEISSSDNPRMKGEWYWRIAKVFLVPILAVFALALSYVDSRGGKSGGMVIAFVVYFVYSNLLNYTVALVQKGQAQTPFLIWLTHVAFALLAMFFLYRRNQNLTLIPNLFSFKSNRLKRRREAT